MYMPKQDFIKPNHKLCRVNVDSNIGSGKSGGMVVILMQQFIVM